MADSGVDRRPVPPKAVQESHHRASAPAAALLASAFVVATCGLVYELLASTLASYLLGDSVTQFSTITSVTISTREGHCFGDLSGQDMCLQ